MNKFKFVWQYLSTTLPVFKKALGITDYRVYRAFITQLGSDDPVAIVIENTLGMDVTFEYSDTGVFYAYTSEVLFDGPTTILNGKPVTVTMTPSSVEFGIGNIVTLSSYPIYSYVIQMTSTMNGVRTNNIIGGDGLGCMLEIKVYN
jgi:hypothetical protein